LKRKRVVRKSDYPKDVERALKRAARRAREIARVHHTPIYVWENGKVVALKP
jgi:hypothetical protein